jgi:hypothetical protein
MAQLVIEVHSFGAIINMFNTYSTIRSVATSTRKWAEINRGHFASDLGGMCAKAAAELFKRLTEKGVKCQIGYSRGIGGHCYVIVLDVIEWVIDVTATQFNHKLFGGIDRSWPAVVFMRLEDVKDDWYHNPDRRFDSVEEFREWQVKDNWPVDQLC